MPDYGREQLQRITMLSGQGKLELEDIKELIVFEAKNVFQKIICQAVKKSQQEKCNSFYVYSQSEQLLLEELGLSNWKMKHNICYVTNFSDTKEAGRIDAEYFQPKYDAIIKAVKRYKGGWDILGKKVKIKGKNYNPEEKKEYKYIELANIGTNGIIEDCTIELGKELPSMARRRVNTGDVIISSIEDSLTSIAIVSKEYDNALCSTGFYVINGKELNSETLFCYLKSVTGQMQFKKGCSGTILTAINKDEFRRIIIPQIDIEVQKKIQEKIRQSFEARAKSKILLEVAKRAVEMAIEKDEQSAMKWIEKRKV
jgi:hypothetical protein